MVQDPVVKPPDGGLDTLTCSRSATDRRQKTHTNSEHALKCPRCESTNTKFCYFNNYSLTQPRHFCKSCRRYWTKGGALRNVPIGGGCRKNKRVKHNRSGDPSSLGSLEDMSASNMLASISNASCSALLPNFHGNSTSNFGDLPSESQIFKLASEYLRVGQQSGAVSSNPALFGMGGVSSQTTAGLLSSTSGQSSLLASVPAYNDNAFASIAFPTATVKTEQGAVLYNGSDLFIPMYEAPAHMAAGSATATLASIEDQLSNFALPVETFNGGNVLQPHKFTLQLVNDVQSGADRGHTLPAFEDETNENLRRPNKGKAITLDGRSLSVDWPHHVITENLFDAAGPDYHNFWNPGWPDMHAIAGSTAGGML